MATLEGRWWYGGVGATLYIVEITEPEHVDGFVMDDDSLLHNHFNES